MQNNQDVFSLALRKKMEEEGTHDVIETARKVQAGYALEAGKKHVYGGTIPAATIAKRRAANKLAKKSRKVNR